MAGADLPAFWKEVIDLALNLEVQGRSLQVPRSGPDPRQILQAVVQAISQCGSSAYDVDMAHAEELLNQPAVTKTVLHELRRRMVRYWNNKNPSKTPQKRMIGAIYPADPSDRRKEHCTGCGGEGHLKDVCPSIQIDTGRSRREFKFSDTVDENGGRKRNNDRDKNKRGEQEKKVLPTEWNPKFGKCRLKIDGVACGEEHMHSQCKKGAVAYAAKDYVKLTAAGTTMAVIEMPNDFNDEVEVFQVPLSTFACEHIYKNRATAP
jgi:hypothetical protein